MRFLLFVVSLISIVALAQARTVAWDGASVQVEQVQLTPLPDGGCSATWCGSVATDDGPVRACTAAVDLRTATNINRCGALLTAGTNRVLRELRFTVDGGNP